MSLYFSPSNAGFYDVRIHKDLPSDARAISAAYHAALMDAQSKGKQIKANADGSPVAADPDPMTADELLQRLRWKRDQLLADSDFTQVADTPLSAQTRAAWATYRQALRDLPQTLSDPAHIVWPVPPAEG